MGRLPDLLKIIKRQEAAIEALTARLAALETEPDRDPEDTCKAASG